MTASWKLELFGRGSAESEELKWGVQVQTEVRINFSHSGHFYSFSQLFSSQSHRMDSLLNILLCYCYYYCVCDECCQRVESLFRLIFPFLRVFSHHPSNGQRAEVAASRFISLLRQQRSAQTCLWSHLYSCELQNDGGFISHWACSLTSLNNGNFAHQFYKSHSGKPGCQTGCISETNC